jgi:hypothetical protein
MKAAYIGILTPGSTSRMRAEVLKRLTPGVTWTWIDTDVPMSDSSRLWRTVAFRTNSGQAVNRINSLVTQQLKSAKLDLAWVDKGVFLTPPTIASIRSRAGHLVHFTPDTAFHANRSRHFENSIGQFDLLVTTKSFEVDEYTRRVPRERVLLTTQGYDSSVHVPGNLEFENRRREAVFVGLAEPDREKCIDVLLEADVPVRLAGYGWSRLVRRWKDHPGLVFEGAGVFGRAYAELLSSSCVGLGLLSKRFPELHTTRTFEIPACESALATERTADTTRFFSESEAIFFTDYDELAEQLRSLLHAPVIGALSDIALAGRKRVVADGRDYDSILQSVLSHPRIAFTASGANVTPG